MTLTKGALFVPVNQYPYGARNSAVLATRLPHETLSRVQRAAERRGITVANFVRLALAGAPSGGSRDPSAVLADLCQALGIPPDSDPADVLSAVQAVISAVSPPDGSAPPATPSKLGVGIALSRETKAKLKARGMSEEEFAELKRDAVKRI